MQKKIIKAATLGTNRISYKSETLPFGEFSQKEKEENQLLRDAAVYTFAKKAGFQAKTKKTDLIEATSPETKKYLSEKTVPLLKETTNEFILQEFLGRTSEAQKIVLPVSLPNLLDKAIVSTWNPKTVLELVGERGKWLIQFKKAWRDYFEPLSEKDWATGSIEKRIRYLQEMRRKDKEQANQLFSEIVKEESVANLVKLVSTFQENLNKDDEPLLFSLIKHARKEVRGKALSFLQQISDSDYSKRMQELCETLVQSEKKGMGLLVLKVKLPQTLTKEMQEEGLSDDFVVKGLGEKAARLVQILQVIPPKFWEEKFQEAPENIIDSVEKNMYNQALLQGIVNATILHKDVDWARAISKRISLRRVSFELLTEKSIAYLVCILPPEKMSEVLLAGFKKTKNLEEDNLVLHPLFSYNRTINLEASIRFWDLMKDHLIANKIMYSRNPELVKVLPEVLEGFYLFPIEILSTIRELWKDQELSDVYRDFIQEVIDKIENRKKMLEAINESP